MIQTDIKKSETTLFTENIQNNNQNKLIAEITLPGRLRNKVFKNFEGKKTAVETCIKYLQKKTDKTCLFLCGNVGSGKTHLAVATAVNWLPIVNPITGLQTAKAKFSIADEWFTELNELVYRKESKLKYISDCLLYDVFVLDDLGAGTITEAKKENLYLLINKAYLEKRYLIITTNLTFEEVEKLDERISDRLKEMAIILLFEDNESFRNNLI